MYKQNEPVKALIDEHAIYCGKCGHKVAEIRKGKMYILCNHKDRGNRCKVESEIDIQARKEQ